MTSSRRGIAVTVGATLLAVSLISIARYSSALAFWILFGLICCLALFGVVAVWALAADWILRGSEDLNERINDYKRTTLRGTSRRDLR